MILGVLCDVYPGHPWAVRVYDGGFFIQYLDRPFSQPYGMNCKYRDVAHDAAVMKREIIMKAGEWLERAGLVRGRYNGDEITYVEGVPDKYQNRELPTNIDITVEDAPDTEETRIRDASGNYLAPEQRKRLRDA